MEDEFVRRWGEWADWSHRQGLGAHPRLLRDVESPGTYISFGPWASIDAVRGWRSLTGYHEPVARLREVVESLGPRTFESWQSAERRAARRGTSERESGMVDNQLIERLDFGQLPTPAGSGRATLSTYQPTAAQVVTP